MTRLPSLMTATYSFGVACWCASKRIGLPATIALAYAVDVAYLAAVAWLRRPRPVSP